MEAAKFERIVGSIARNPDHPNWKIARNLEGVNCADVEAARAIMGGETARPAKAAADAESIEAIPLNQKRVMPQKPQGSDCRRRIRDIKRGVCHRVPAFAAFLGISEDTLRRHAKALGCLKWVEMTPDNFEEAVMNPDTAKQYMR